MKPKLPVIRSCGGVRPLVDNVVNRPFSKARKARLGSPGTGLLQKRGGRQGTPCTVNPMYRRVGYLGPEGTFSQQAAFLYRNRRLQGVPVVFRSFDSIPELILAVAAETIDEAVVPLENSLEGAVPITLDMMAHEVELKMAAEIVIPVRHFLLGPAGTELSDISRVISHPQALAQCRSFLREQLPRAQPVSVNSTAEAARRVAAGDFTGAAAIGTMAAARAYGLVVLVSDIQDNRDNATRFCVLASSDSAPTGHDKTSFVFSTRENRPGILCEQLQEFASRGINLTRIESRPAKSCLGEYLFFLDIVGHRTDPPVAAALQAVAGRSSFFRMFGSYPQWESDTESPSR